MTKASHYFNMHYLSLLMGADFKMCMQFGPRSDPLECRSESNPFSTLIAFLKKIKFENSQQKTTKAKKKYLACKAFMSILFVPVLVQYFFSFSERLGLKTSGKTD